jgi:hypothetical protein
MPAACYDFSTCAPVYRRDVTGLRDPKRPGYSLDTRCGSGKDAHDCSEDEWKARNLGDVGGCVASDWTDQSACCCGRSGKAWPAACPDRSTLDCGGGGGDASHRDHVGCSDTRNKQELLDCCMRRRMDSGRIRPGRRDDRPFPHAVCDAVLQDFQQNLGPPSDREFDDVPAKGSGM